MTEPPALPPPEPHDEPVPDPVPPEPPRRPLLPWLSAAGFVVLAAALFLVWQHPLQPPATEAEAQARQIAALDARVARLEQRPAPQSPDLAPLAARVAALEQRPPAASASSGQTPDLAPLAARVAVLEQHQGASPNPGPSPNLVPLEARIAALEAKQPADSQLPGRIDALSARADSFGTALQALQSDVPRRLDADEARLVAVDRVATQVATLTERTARIARVQAAQLALDAGQPLGDVQGAPPALARFANAAAPTEAGLRLAFPPAAQAALAAAHPSSDGKPLLARVWAQAQDLVTIRQGDRVLVGDPTAGILERAHAALEAGDLAGAAAAVASLDGPSAQAMAAWLADARGLLEARAALAQWAAHG
jgi:hypothetical protein